MTLSVVPVSAVPDQTVQCFLNGQNCTLRLYQRMYGYFVDLYVNNVVLRRGMEALNMTKIVRDNYIGFKGDLFFFDTQGTESPEYSQVGTRFVLLYDDTL